MDATKPNIPDLDELERKLRKASVAHDDGKRYVRASVAAIVIGVRQGHQTMWIRHGLIHPLRFKVPRSQKALMGIVTAWPLDESIAAARRYWSGGRRWSRQEDDYLLEQLGKRNVDTLASEMGRSVEAIKQRARYFGVNQFNAQGELTTGEVAKLAGVCRATVLRVWCNECEPPLGSRVMEDNRQTRMISPSHLAKFFRNHPHLLARRSKAVQQRIERFTMTAHQRRKLVAS